MEQRSAHSTSSLSRRRVLIAAGASGAALLLGRQIDARGATTTSTPQPSQNETPVTTAAGAHEATPAGSPAATPVASPATSPAATGPVFEASMQSLQFIPQEIDIKAGTTVIWTNKDVVAHTVTHRAKPEDQLFSSPMLMPGDSFSFTFEKPGTYAYFCMPHPFMTGTVVVS